MLESDRIGKLLNGNIFFTPVLGEKKAFLACTEPENMDLVIGQDMVTAYLEQDNMNHVFRILETIILRLKKKQSVVIFK